MVCQTVFQAFKCQRLSEEHEFLSADHEFLSAESWVLT